MLDHLKEFFGVARQLADITPPDIEGYKLQRRKQVSGATVKKVAAVGKLAGNCYNPATPCTNLQQS